MREREPTDTINERVKEKKNSNILFKFLIV